MAPSQIQQKAESLQFATTLRVARCVRSLPRAIAVRMGEQAMDLKGELRTCQFGAEKREFPRRVLAPPMTPRCVS